MKTLLSAHDNSSIACNAKFCFSLRQGAALVFALVYGAVLSRIPSEDFKDFSNYLAYAEYSWERLLGNLSDGPAVILSNEPVWLLINAALGHLLPAEEVVRLIIFISASTVAWVVLKHYQRQFVWVLIFLLLPIVIKNHLIHLRQGVAISIFLLGWFSSGRWNRWVFLSLAPLIHSSFFLVLLILCLARAMTRLKLGPDIRITIFVMVGVSVSAGLVWLAALLGARQAYGYQFSMTDLSGFGFVLWFGIFFLFIAEGRQFLRIHAFETGVIVFYLSTYWLIEVTARILESGLFLILLAGLALTGWRRFAYLVTVIFAFFCFPWMMRINLPALGFGIG